MFYMDKKKIDIVSWFDIILDTYNIIHYGIVSYDMTLFCMICYNKKMYRINTILYHTIKFANKKRYFKKKPTGNCKKNPQKLKYS